YGLHAALYGATLPHGIMHVTQSPVPGFGAGTGAAIAQQIERYYQMRGGLLALLNAAIHSDAIDEVVAWGGHLEYLCAWVQVIEQATALPHCVWLLRFPGVERWSRAVNGHPVPWHGMYQAPLPDGAKLVTGKDIERAKQTDFFNRVVLEGTGCADPKAVNSIHELIRRAGRP
ncbi:MAG: hypothetical protein K2Q20_05970, partial [Phycisphaerales bacterium]|nr:hypothetical protein [Phycisphaerales bacterium]